MSGVCSRIVHRRTRTSGPLPNVGKAVWVTGGGKEAEEVESLEKELDDVREEEEVVRLELEAEERLVVVEENK